jgi:hypothetical protein
MNTNSFKELIISKTTLLLNDNRKPPFIKHKSLNNNSNISILTTKPENNSDRILTLEKRNSKNLEDSIFDLLQNRGLLDSSLEKQLNEYRLLANSNNETIISIQAENSLKISLLNEYEMVKKNNSISSKQIENLRFITDIKLKKIEFLRNTISSIKNKINILKEKEDNKSKTERILNEKDNNNIKENDRYNYIINNSIDINEYKTNEKEDIRIKKNNEINLLKKVKIKSKKIIFFLYFILFHFNKLIQFDLFIYIYIYIGN